MGFRGTMSEAELHWLHCRLVGGKLEKAQHGTLPSTARVQVNPRPWEWRHADGSMKLVIVTQSVSADELGTSPT